MGKLNAALSLSRALQRESLGDSFDRVVNLGICGSVVSHFDVGDVVGVSSVSEGDRDSFGESLTLDLTSWDRRLPRGILVTQDRAVKTAKQKKQVLDSGGELVDMEAFALAKVARVFGVPFYCVKVVSDRVSPRSSKAILKNLAPCSKKLCERVASL